MGTTIPRTMQDKGLPYEAKTAGNLMSAARCVSERDALVAATLDMDLGHLGSVFYGFYPVKDAQNVARRIRRNRKVRVVCVDVITTDGVITF